MVNTLVSLKYGLLPEFLFRKSPKNLVIHSVFLFFQDCVGEFEGTVCDEGDITKLKDFNMPTLVTKEVLDSWNLDDSFYEKCPVVK